MVGAAPVGAFPIGAAPWEGGLPSPEHVSILVRAAVVTLGGKTHEGQLIQAVAPAWFEILKLLQQDFAAVMQIPPRKWEEIIAGSYERAGFDEVTLTPASGDGGRDVIAVKKGFWSVRIVEQVKRYKPGLLVTAEEVRALGFVLQADQNTSKGVVSTTSDFAPKITEDELIKPFLPHRLELVNGEELLKRLSGGAAKPV